MSFWKWSRTASSNATADTSINWAEGQAPSTVNDSGRAMMAAAAKFRDDISGAIATGGSSTAYTVTSYQAFDTLANMNGAMIAFTPHTTSGTTVTLNVDGLGAKPLRLAPGVTNELPAGTLVQGTPYVATYYNATAEWILQGLAGNPYNIPLGGMLEFTGTTAPNGSFVLPFGQAISRTTYADVLRDDRHDLRRRRRLDHVQRHRQARARVGRQGRHGRLVCEPADQPGRRTEWRCAGGGGRSRDAHADDAPSLPRTTTASPIRVTSIPTRCPMALFRPWRKRVLRQRKPISPPAPPPP